MLTNTFSHISGIGLKTEEHIWAAGIRTWDDFLTDPGPLSLSPGRIDLIREKLVEARQRLPHDPRYFADLLPAASQWRLFPHYRQATAFLDIETTGLGTDSDEITTIAIYDGQSISWYVNGENLDEFPEAIKRFRLLVTYNGKCFDIPFLERFFGITLDQAHIDLRFVLRNLGLTGGLKGCEKQLGLDRGELAGVDGYFAVLLWREYLNTGQRPALETLLAYNIQDVVNLEMLMVEAYNRNISATVFAASHRLPCPAAPRLPFFPDPKIISKIRNSFPPGFSYSGR